MSVFVVSGDCGRSLLWVCEWILSALMREECGRCLLSPRLGCVGEWWVYVSEGKVGRILSPLRPSQSTLTPRPTLSITNQKIGDIWRRTLLATLNWRKVIYSIKMNLRTPEIQFHIHVGRPGRLMGLWRHHDGSSKLVTCCWIRLRNWMGLRNLDGPISWRLRRAYI